jgi:hypothetical protein
VSYFALAPSLIPHLAGTYDPELGWKVPVRPSAKLPPIASAFGDSFTFGSGVGDHDTWEEQFALSAQKSILNFGVPGYGIDQAVLYFEKRGRDAPGKYAILAYIAGDLVRDETVYRPFLYGSGDQLTLTKPRFRLEKDGHLTEIQNPIASSAALSKLSDPGFFTELESLDAYRIAGRERFPSIAFPRLGLLWDSRFFGQLKGFILKPVRPQEDLRLAQALIERFRQSACQAGKVPLLAYLPTRFENSGKELCLRAGMPCLLPEERPLLNSPENFARDGHYSPAGNRVIAQEMDRFLRRVEQKKVNPCARGLAEVLVQRPPTQHM